MQNSTRERREILRELLRRRPAGSQRALLDALTRHGLDATQSSVSRDLKYLGAIKTTKGYELPGDPQSAAEQMQEIAEFIRDVLPAGSNLIVIKTAIGAAQRVALALDRASWPEMVGNIGGDDTVFVATNGSSEQKILMNRITRARAGA